MNLKKKVIFGMVAGFFAVATVFNMSMLNENGAGDITLDAVSIMAQAQSEDGEHENTQTIDKHIEEVTYKKWDAKLKIWIFNSVGGEGYKKVTVSYTYKCCFSGGPGCSYDLC